jgi:uncharacterized protein (TIGR03067 family)
MVARVIALFLVASLVTAFGCSGASDKSSPQGTGTPQPGADPTKDDKGGLQALQGTWVPIAVADKGDPIRSVKYDEDEPWVIQGSKFIYYDSIKRNDVKRAADLKVDPSKDPAHIDFTIKGKWEGKEMEWTTYGIYSLKGDELTVCVPEKFDPWEPENRPKEFKSTQPPKDKDSGFNLYVLKKKK